MSARIVHQRTGKTIGVFADYVEAATYRADVLRPALAPNTPCPFAIRSGGVKVGHLFTADVVSTQPCVHCGSPAVDADGGPFHFIVGDNGAKTAGRECMTTKRGRSTPAGTTAELSRALIGSAPHWLRPSRTPPSGRPMRRPGPPVRLARSRCERHRCDRQPRFARPAPWHTQISGQSAYLLAMTASVRLGSSVGCWRVALQLRGQQIHSSQSLRVVVVLDLGGSHLLPAAARPHAVHHFPVESAAAGAGDVCCPAHRSPRAIRWAMSIALSWAWRRPCRQAVKKAISLPPRSTAHPWMRPLAARTGTTLIRSFIGAPGRI
ncbi:hypothetical protein SEA_NAIRB_54 [Mycobacterium phage Nairb]|uniref:Uncharacterized protein n=3 Tax=Bernalvirus bernal13 TaxID=1982102 RepID=A0A2P1JRX1_9CAUD|nr:hypothetical protein FH37_gp54 [Mycobacterium phage Bernal13]AHY26970.1 hypothetical protein PBI_BERNAL13_55 [Mycobacterium phage Bernal13]AVO21842.1 hypothetical protein SEA_NAIRB_54 [Mycobacterium phage Nairb]QHB47459.1 hypothetical protein SEA_WHITTY_54 [Mycobacterium phage Whitty]